MSEALSSTATMYGGWCVCCPGLMAIKVKVTKHAHGTRHCVLTVRQALVVASSTEVETEAQKG